MCRLLFNPREEVSICSEGDGWCTVITITGSPCVVSCDENMAPLLTAICVVATVVSIVFPAEGTVFLTGCKYGNITQIENFGYYNYLKCFDLTNPEALHLWTLKTENGTEVSLGTCDTVNNCTNFLDYMHGFLSRPYPLMSQFYIRKFQKDLSGNITCTVVTPNTMDTSSCQLNVVRVRAYRNVMEMQEGPRYTSSEICHLSRIDPQHVTVTLTLNSGVTIPLGGCTRSSCSSPSGNFSLYRGYSYISLTVLSRKRDLAGNLTCTFTYKDQTETAHTLLNIFNPPTVNNCRIDVQQRNWSAVLSCDVVDAFSSAGIYQYQLVQLRRSSFLRYYVNRYYLRYAKTSPEQKVIDRRSFLPNLHSYMNYTANQTYYGGRLEYSWRLSSSDKDFEYAAVIICTTLSIYPCVYSSPMFLGFPTVSTPGAPSHNCTQPSIIPENGTIICTCITDSVGSPPGRLMWLVDKVVWSTGQYGVRQLSLSTESMTRQQNLKQATCRLEWIDPQYVHLPLNVAYGPDKVDLHVYQRTDTDDKLMMIECQVTGLNPRSPDMVQWEGPCQGQQGFTCTLDLRQTDVNGKTVTCRVTNSANNGHTAEGVKVIRTDLTMALPDSSSDNMKWAAIGGGVLLAVVVVISLLVTLVIWVCRRGFPRSVPQPKDDQQTNNSADDQHTYEALTTINRAGQQPSRTSASSHVYENTGFS